VRPVHLVLDTSALIAYADLDRGMPVAEAIAMVEEDGAAAAIPAAAFAAAIKGVGKPDARTRLERLVISGVCPLLDLSAHDATPVGFLAAEFDLDIGDAHAIQETINHDEAQLATFAYASIRATGWLSGDRILRLDMDWDDEPPMVP